MSKLTVLTPTYNRADRLEKLFLSLKTQSVQDFEWVVVDDGSSDNTGKQVVAWMQNAPFPIVYIYKKNGGKHTALNLGISKIVSELTFIVDSDDWLTENAVDIILSYHDKYKERIEKEKICGFSFLRAFSDGSVNTRAFPVDEAVDTYRQQRINNHLLGDKAEVFYTNILKQFPFEEFEGEKFFPEDAVWLKMSGPYKVVHINKVIYYSEYLEGGLTKAGRKMKIRSPYGMMYRSAVFLNDPDIVLNVKIKMMLLYHIYFRFACKNYGKAAVSAMVMDKCHIRKDAMYYFLKLPAWILLVRWK